MAKNSFVAEPLIMWSLLFFSFSTFSIWTMLFVYDLESTFSHFPLNIESLFWKSFSTIYCYSEIIFVLIPSTLRFSNISGSLIYNRRVKGANLKSDWCFCNTFPAKSVYYILTYFEGVLILIEFIYNLHQSSKVM